MGFWKDWLDQGKQPVRVQKSQDTSMVHPTLRVPGTDIEGLTNSLDPLSAIQAVKSLDPARLIVGEQAANLSVTAPDNSVLVLGPPRSAGKTSAYMIPNMLTHRGPAVSVSTKPDVVVATSMLRRRSGNVWQFSPDGSPMIRGMKQVRWSPISANWAECLARSDWMVKAANMTAEKGGTNSSFFGPRAGDLLAAVMYYAGAQDLEMAWVVEMVTGMRLVELRRVAGDLETMQPMAGAVLGGIVKGNDRTTADIFATASVVLRPYLLPGALAVTEDPNFDVDEFVIGKPEERNLFVAEHFMNGDVVRYDRDGETVSAPEFKNWVRQLGVYDTVYISVDRENMALVAPLIIGFLGDIRRARGKVATREALADVKRSPAVLWAIDEMASVPIPDLPEVLRDSGSNGLLILGALQTLSQTAVWGDQGKGMETLFNYIVAFRGIRDRDTLELLSLLSGDFDRPVWGGGYSNGQYGTKEWHDNLSWTRERRLPPDVIYNGHPQNPDAALVMIPSGWTWVTTQHWYRTNNWPLIVSFSVKWSLAAPDEWFDPLPMPDLTRGGNDSIMRSLSGAAANEWARYQQVYAHRLAAMGVQA